MSKDDDGSGAVVFLFIGAVVLSVFVYCVDRICRAIEASHSCPCAQQHHEDTKGEANANR